MLGEKIKKLRKENKLTQAAFANELNKKFNLNIERSMVSKWESGYQTPQMYTIVCIAQYFKVSIDSLTGEQTVVENVEQVVNAFSEEKQYLLALISSLHPDDQDKALEYVEFLKSKRDQ